MYFISVNIFVSSNKNVLYSLSTIITLKTVNNFLKVNFILSLIIVFFFFFF